MSKAFVVVESVIMLSVLVLIGYISVKTKYITKQMADVFSKIITRLLLPALIAKVILSDKLSIEQIKVSLPLYLLAIAFVIFEFIVAYLISKLVKTPKNEAPAFIYFMSMTNVLFMGLPVCVAIFGQESAFFVTVVTFAQDTVLWTVGVLLLSKFRHKGEIKAKLKISPITISFIVSVILKLLGFKLPNLFFVPLDNIGNSVAYLAMIYLGMLLSFENIIKVLSKFRTYIYLVMKLIVFPVIAGFVIYKIFGSYFDNLQKGVFVIEFATSSVIALLPVFKEYELNPEYASGLVFSGTVLCLATMPLVIILTNVLYLN